MGRVFSTTILMGILALGSSIALALGGPPLITDDPDTPGSGHWEINIGMISEFSSTESATTAPNLDVNYGLGPRTQLKVESGWIYASSQDAGVHRGFGATVVGAKYRFFDEDGAGLSVSTYPQVSFRNFFSSDQFEVSESGTRFFLPLEIQRSFGFLTVNAEAGYSPTTQGPAWWLYGLVLGHEFVEEQELMIEAHGRTRTDDTSNELLVNAGINSALYRSMRLLFSLGHTLKVLEDEHSRFLGYLGIQLKI